VQSLSQLSPWPSSPIPSHFESTTPPLHGFDPANGDIEQLYSNLGYAPPGSDSDAANENPLPASSQHIPIPPSITRTYHPKLDGKLIFIKYMQILTLPPVGRSVVRMVRTYSPTHCHHLMTPIRDLMTGHYIIPTWNLKLLTFYSTKIRCPLGISTSCSACGLHHLLSMVMNCHFQRLLICTIQLILLLLAILHENPLACSTMEPDLLTMYHHGWRWSMTFGSGIPTFLFTTSYLILISNPILIMHHFKSTQLMGPITFKISCPEIGLGHRQYVFATISLI